MSGPTLDALRSADARVRVAALAALAEAGAPIETGLALAVAECVAVDVKAVQRRAADVLRLASDAARPEVLRALRASLAGDDPSGRWGAAYALGHLGVLDAALIPPLAAALASRDGDRRWAAAALLVACGAIARADVVATMRETLDAVAPEARKMALYVLRDLGVGDDAIVVAMLAALRDPDSSVRLAALSAMTKVVPARSDVCDAIVRIAQTDPDVGVRRAAVSALGDVGRGIVAAETVLATALASSDDGMRRAAATARRRRGD